MVQLGGSHSALMSELVLDPEDLGPPQFLLPNSLSQLVATFHSFIRKEMESLFGNIDVWVKGAFSTAVSASWLERFPPLGSDSNWKLFVCSCVYHM